MATAAKTYETRMVEQLVPAITLTLTVAEAETLKSLTDAVGGCPTDSPRAHAEAVRRALSEAGIQGWPAALPAKLMEGSIRFADYPADGDDE